MQPSHSLSPASPLHSIFSNISGISKELTLHIRWPKYWHFSFSISLSNECSGRISFRIDWFDLLAVQGILKSLLQHHNLKSRFLSLSLLYDLTLTSVYDYWKNYSKKKKIKKRYDFFPSFITIPLFSYGCPLFFLFFPFPSFPPLICLKMFHSMCLHKDIS